MDRDHDYSLSCSGCTDWEACNYCYEATIDNGTCDYESCLGCWDDCACWSNTYYYNYIDDGSCEYTSCAGCTDPFACNFDWHGRLYNFRVEADMVRLWPSGWHGAPREDVTLLVKSLEDLFAAAPSAWLQKANTPVTMAHFGALRLHEAFLATLKPSPTKLQTTR